MPPIKIYPANETAGQRANRLARSTGELNDAHDDLQRLAMATKLFYPERIYQAVTGSLPPITIQLFNILSFQHGLTTDGDEQAQRTREKFNPLAKHAGDLLREHLEELKRLPD